MVDDDEYIGAHHPLATEILQTLAERLILDVGVDNANDALEELIAEPGRRFDPDLAREAMRIVLSRWRKYYMGWESEPDEDDEVLRVGSYFADFEAGPRTFVVELYDEGIGERFYDYVGEPPLQPDDLPLPAEEWVGVDREALELAQQFWEAEDSYVPEATPGRAILDVQQHAGGRIGLLASVAAAWESALPAAQTEADEWRTFQTTVQIALPWMPLITDPERDVAAIGWIAEQGIREPDPVALEEARKAKGTGSTR